MTPDGLPLRIEDLLEHREFVRRLARTLVRDEHAAQDLAQDAWVAALHRPPRSSSSARGWLARVTRNLASNARRSEGRRTVHERRAAQSEAVDPDEELHERVAVQHEVVEAVLRMREPYRTTVLLHYYEGLSAVEIAARRHTPAGTVRAQLSRAVEHLRERLDRRHGGERRAWSAALVGLVRRPAEATASPLGGGLALKLGASAALVGGVALASWLAWPRPPARGASLTLASEPVRRPLPPPLAPEPGGGPLSSPAVASARMPVAVPAPEATPRAQALGPDLESLPVPKLVELATRIEHLLRKRLLTPDERFETEQAALLRLPDTGLARILPRGRFGSGDRSPVMLRGAGAYYSFATRSNDYDLEPDLGLDQGYYGASFYGGQRGFILPLGTRALVDLVPSASAAPADLSSSEREAWDLLWSDVPTTENAVDAAFSSRGNELRLDRGVRAVVGSTYLVRVVSPSEHDHLVAFTFLEEDDYGHTLAWRILHRWDLGGARGTRKTEIFLPGMPDSEPWMLEASIEELLGVLARIKSIGEERLLAVPADLEARHGGQLARILDGDSYECVIQKRGGGRYFSFETLDNDYDSEPDLELYRRTFTSGFAGHDQGFLLDLGEVPLEQVGDSRFAAPSTLADEGLEAWDFLWDVRVPPAPRGDRSAQALSADDLARARELGVDRGVAAELDHAYLLRSIIVGGHDLLVAFTPVASDEYGLFLAWRLLRRR